MALTGLVDNTKYLRTDKPQLIQGANYGNGKLVINGRYDYQPLHGLNWDDESTQVCNTNFVSNYARKKYAATTGTINLVENRFYSVSISGNTTFVIPTPKNKNINNEIMITIHYTGGTVNFGTNVALNGMSQNLSPNNYYNLYYDYDCINNVWAFGVIKVDNVETPTGGVISNIIVFSSRVAGNYIVTIPYSTNYRITAVGGGGGGCTASGGSSGMFIGDIRLFQGARLSIAIGRGGVNGNRNTSDSGNRCRGGATSISGLLTINGGYGGGAQRHSSATAQKAGEKVSGFSNLFQVVKNIGGNTGDGWVNGGHGGFSVVDGTLSGAGAGGSGTNRSTKSPGAAGQTGWVEIRTI